MNPSVKQAQDAPLYTPGDFSPADTVFNLISQARGRMVSALDARMAPHDMTAAQWTILMYIHEGCGDTAAVLCRHCSYDTGSMTRMLDRLEEKGLISRVRSEEDRRRVQIRLTPAGRELIATGSPIAVEQLNLHLRGFSREEHDTLKSLLRRIVANAGE